MFCHSEIYMMESGSKTYAILPPNFMVILLKFYLGVLIIRN